MPLDVVFESSATFHKPPVHEQHDITSSFRPNVDHLCVARHAPAPSIRYEGCDDCLKAQLACNASEHGVLVIGTPGTNYGLGRKLSNSDKIGGFNLLSLGPRCTNSSAMIAIPSGTFSDMHYYTADSRLYPWYEYDDDVDDTQDQSKW